MKNLIQKYYRFKAIRSLSKRYAYEQVVNELMEEYDTHKLLNGDLNEKGIAQGRASLSEIQAKMRETTKLLDFLSQAK